MAAGRVVLSQYFPARDRNGRLVAGARLFVYENGTTTKAAIYSNSGLSTPMANPVVANASGQFPSIWADDGVTYTLSITGADGSSIGNPSVFDDFSVSVDAMTESVSLAEAAAAAAQAYYEDILAIEGEADPSIAIATRAAKAANLSDLGDREAAYQNLNFLAAGTGAVVRSARDKNRDYISVKDFGATGLGVLADSAKIQAAINSLKPGGANQGKRLLFPGGGVWFCENLDLTDLADVEFIGYGATVKASQRVKSYFDMKDSAGGLVFKGFTFDGMQPVLPVYTEVDYIEQLYNCPIYAYESSGSAVVDGCKFINIYSGGIQWRLSGDLTVRNCAFDFPLCTQTYLGTPAVQWLDGIRLQSINANVLIDNCVFQGAATTNPALGPCAVFASGTSGSLVITNIRADYCGHDNTGTHRLGVIDFYGDVGNVTLRNVVSTNTMSAFSRLSACHVGLFENIHVTASTNAELDYYCINVESTVFGGRLGARDVTVRGLTVIDPSSRYSYALGCSSYDYQAYARRIRFEDITTAEARTAIIVQGPCRDVRIKGVYASSATGVSGAILLLAPGGVSLTGTQSTSFYDGLVFNDVTVRNTLSGSGAAAIQTDYSSAATTAFMGSIVVDGLDAHAVANTGQGVIMRQNSTTLANSSFILRNSRITGYNRSVYAREGGEHLVENNKFRSAAGGAILDASSGALRRRGNSIGNGVLRGTGTLVAGVATITSNEITNAADYPTRFIVNRKGGGTANGFLTHTVGAGSAVVTSKDAANATVATDNGTFEWEAVN